MHETAVDVRVQKVRHSEDGAVSKRTQIGAGTFAATFVALLLCCLLRTVIEKVHEEREVSGVEANKINTVDVLR